MLEAMVQRQIIFPHDLERRQAVYQAYAPGIVQQARKQSDNGDEREGTASE